MLRHRVTMRSLEELRIWRPCLYNGSSPTTCAFLGVPAWRGEEQGHVGRSTEHTCSQAGWILCSTTPLYSLLPIRADNERRHSTTDIVGNLSKRFSWCLTGLILTWCACGPCRENLHLLALQRFCGNQVRQSLCKREVCGVHSL